MTTFTFEPTPDDELAIALDLAKVNGQLAGNNQPPIDAQTMFTMTVRQRWLAPISQQIVQGQLSPIITDFLKRDAAGRAALLAIPEIDAIVQAAKQKP